MLRHRGKVILCSHLGRPKGKPNPKYSLRPIVDRLRVMLDHSIGEQVNVAFAPDCVGELARELANKLEDGKVLLLENLRFYAGEEANDPGFAKKLAAYARSTLTMPSAPRIAHTLPPRALLTSYNLAVAGLLLEKELNYMGKALTNPAKPFIAILGGAKVSDKIQVIDNLLTKVNAILIGGGMAYTFLKAQGLEVGKSLVEADKLDVARQAMAAAKARGVRFHLPVDHVLANRFAPDAKTRVVEGDEGFPADWMALDIGPKTVDLFAREIADAGTIVWNGPMGVFEMPAFAHGTVAIAELVAGNRDAVSIVGGGAIRSRPSSRLASRTALPIYPQAGAPRLSSWKGKCFLASRLSRNHASLRPWLWSISNCRCSSWSRALPVP